MSTHGLGPCAELHGPGRAAGLRRWITIMQSLSTPPHQALYTSSATSSEGDWQTLTQVRLSPLLWGLQEPCP